MYIIMSYIHFGIIEQQVQVYFSDEIQIKLIETQYSTLDNLEKTFLNLADKYQTPYIKLPNTPEIEAELVKKYDFKIFKEEQENE